jgi:hypothetical protein
MTAPKTSNSKSFPSQFFFATTIIQLASAAQLKRRSMRRAWANYGPIRQQYGA